MNLEPSFKKYEELVYLVDSIFDKFSREFPAEVQCKIGCSDCCHAMFDVGLVEAIYINRKFHEILEDEAREKILEKANEADRQAYKIKRRAYRDREKGVDEREIFESIARQRIRCPLLNESDRCDLYTCRPITCRLYGLPVEIGGESTTCGFSGFEEGKSYPTVKVDSLHGKLYEISDNLMLDIQSGYTRMGELLVPVSMALLTNYDEEYLGVGIPAEAGEQGE